MNNTEIEKSNIGLGIETPLANSLNEIEIPEIKYSGDIGIEELSLELQELIIKGITSGSGGGIQIGSNVSLKSEVKSVIVETDRQKEFVIPMANYKQDIHHFELRLGSAWFSPTRYTIAGNKVILNEDEVGIALGRRLDFVFCYLEKGDGETSAELHGSYIADGSITKTKLSSELQGQISGLEVGINEAKNSVTNIGQTIATLSPKLDSSVKEVEASNNFNSIRIIKNDGTTTDVPIKILGGGSDSSLNVFKTSEKGGSFTAQSETNSFVINELEESMDVNLIFKNLFLVKDVDFTVDKESKTVVLTFNLKENETIYYILTGTSFKYGDLDGAPNVGDTKGLSTTSKEVVGAINEIQESCMKKVDRHGIDLNTLRNTGTQGYCTMCVNTPNVGVDGTFFDYKSHDSTGYQEFSEWNSDTKYFRRYLHDTWLPWQQVATTGQTNLIYNRTIAPVIYNVIPDALYISDEWTGIFCVRTDHGTINAPPNCIIGVRTMKKLDNNNVVVIVDNTQNGERWKNTYNGITWVGWQKVSVSIITKVGESLNQNLMYGDYQFYDAVDGFPNGYVSGNNDFVMQVFPSGTTNTEWQSQVLHDIRSQRFFKRSKIGNVCGEWQEIATSTKVHVPVNTGWTIAPACSSTYSIVGNTLTYSAILVGDGTNVFPVKLPIPKDSANNAMWMAGSAIGNNNASAYLVIQPDGWLNFQSGYTAGVYYAINISYQI